MTLSVTTDRTQGGSSMVDGSVELMVHRRLQHDDSRGVGEPLNEPGLDATGSGLVIRAVHRVSVMPAALAPAHGKQNIQDLTFRPLVTFSALKAGATPASWLAANVGAWTGAGAALPPSIHILTTHAWTQHDVLVRLAHLFESGEDAALSAPVTVDLTTLYVGRTLSACVEQTVPASQPIANVPVRTVNIKGEGPSTFPTIPAPPSGDPQTVTISEMEVRTWLCKY